MRDSVPAGASPIILGGQKHFLLLPSCLHIQQSPAGLSTTAKPFILSLTILPGSATFSSKFPKETTWEVVCVPGISEKVLNAGDFLQKLSFFP